MFRFFKRIWNLIFGAFGLGIKSLEEKHPEIAYENAINSMVEKYATLKHAAAGLINHRAKLEDRVYKIEINLNELEPMIEAAVNQGDDDVALVLISQQEDLRGNLAETQESLSSATKDADSAKNSLNSLKTEIEKLRREKDKIISQIKDAEARRMIQDQLDGLSVDADLKALESVRNHAANLRAEVQIGDELTEDSIDAKLAKIRAKSKVTTAQARLQELKKARASATSSVELELEKSL